MSLRHDIENILDDIKEKENRLQEMHEIWYSETSDPCEQAVCDPSDQFCLGMEIENLWKQLKVLVNENIK